MGVAVAKLKDGSAGVIERWGRPVRVDEHVVGQHQIDILLAHRLIHETANLSVDPLGPAPVHHTGVRDYSRLFQ